MGLSVGLGKPTRWDSPSPGFIQSPSNLLREICLKPQRAWPLPSAVIQQQQPSFRLVPKTHSHTQPYSPAHTTQAPHPHTTRHHMDIVPIREVVLNFTPFPTDSGCVQFLLQMRQTNTEKGTCPKSVDSRAAELI